MDELIARLVTREDGSRKLDEGIDWRTTTKGRWTTRSACYGWPHYRSPPHYTTSRDAALPDEDIRMVLMRDDGRWAAWARNKNGDLYTAEAKTEALARRAAALKARED